jgi:hypothetical protein
MLMCLVCISLIVDSFAANYSVPAIRWVGGTGTPPVRITEVDTDLYIPPPNSPIARREHPRLHFNAASLPALRDKLATVMKTEFQNFINDQDNHFTYATEISQNDTTVKAADIVNYAFLYQIGSLQNLTYQHSQIEYGQLAKALFLRVIRGQAQLEHREAYRKYLPSLGIGYDWLFDLFSESEKQEIVAVLDTMVYKDGGMRTIRSIFDNQIISPRNGLQRHTTIALVLANDPYLPPNRSQEILNIVIADFFNGGFWDGLNFFERGGWSEGQGGYYAYVLENLPLAAHALLTATGQEVLFKDFIGLRYQPLFLYIILDRLPKLIPVIPWVKSIIWQIPLK